LRGNVFSNTDVYYHAVLEVLVACDQGAAVFVLETDAIAVVETIEVLDGGDDGVCRIVWVYIHPYGQSCPLLRGFVQEVLESDLLGRIG
jgi:hypothetical protein